MAPLMPLDVAWIRSQFPALAMEVEGRPAVFLDAPGGTQVPRRVAEAVSTALLRANANLGGSFLTSRRAERIEDEAHAAVADFLGCSPREVVFGPNMTSLTFAFSRAFARELSAGDEILVTQLDHDANVAPWKALEEHGAVVRSVAVRVEDCTLDIDGLRGMLNERTRLVAVGYASNSVGTINDVAAITRAAHEVGAKTFIDAVHYAPHGPIDVRALDCDFLSCSPYKFFGPHQGVLYGKEEHMERLRPYKVRPAEDAAPARWETGTQSVEAMAGVTAAIDYLAELGRRTAGRADLGRREAILAAMEASRAYERGLSEQLVGGLTAIPGLTFYGIREPERFDRRTPTVSIRLAGLTPRELAEELGRRGIFVWDGNYYAINLSERLGLEETGGMVRIGCAHYNTAEEIDRLLTELRSLAA